MFPDDVNATVLKSAEIEGEYMLVRLAATGVTLEPSRFIRNSGVVGLTVRSDANGILVNVGAELFPHPTVIPAARTRRVSRIRGSFFKRSP